MVAGYRKVTPLDHPEYRHLHGSVSGAVWPEFMQQDAIANAHWDGMYENFPEYQFLIQAPQTEAVIGITNSVPLAWDGTPRDLPDEGWDWALVQSALDFKAGRRPKTMCGIQISIAPDFQGQGKSSWLLKEMRSQARSLGLQHLVIPVRPSLKSRYPLVPMEAYIHWQNDQGFPFDPWLRVHVRNGGRIVKVCPLAMRIEGSVADWEAWTGMKFPESFDYYVPGALNPVRIDVDADQGLYIEPNVWVDHPLD